MSKWIIIPLLLFVAVLIFVKMANKQSRSRQQRSFKTNYQSKRDSEQKNKRS
jgi:hypothetical protein